MAPTATRPTALTARLTADHLDGLAQRLTVAAPDRPSLEVRSPFDDRLVGTLPSAAPDDVALALDRARAAQRGWAARSIEERAEVLLRLHDLVLDHQDLLLDLIQLESGKARKHAFEEVADTAIVARYYAHQAARHLRPRSRQGLIPQLTRVREYRHPLGVVGVIAPWNYPLSMAITDALPALAAGNAVVLKPSELTPFTALQAARLLDQAGLPDHVLQVVTGPGEVLGPPLIEGSDGLMFTGSTQVGRRVAAQAGARLIPCSLELGGKNPMIVLDDADLTDAAEGAVRGCFANAGQLCISIERIYVAASVFDAFVEKLVRRVESLRVGAGFDFDTDMGSLISDQQLARVEAHVEEARAGGATIHTGGRRLPELGPRFYAPTIVTEVAPGMQMAREETFGPVIAVYPFETDDEAVRAANDSPYGLNASIWTRNFKRGTRLARRLQAGTVNINEAYAAAWGSVDAPMGGFKASGLGRRHGAPGIQKYTELQTVAVQRLLPVAPPEGLSDERFAGLLTYALRLVRRTTKR